VLGPPLCRIYERSAVGPIPPNAPGPPSLPLPQSGAGFRELRCRGAEEELRGALSQLDESELSALEEIFSPDRAKAPPKRRRASTRRTKKRQR
jgi:hypothetical protein